MTTTIAIASGKGGVGKTTIAVNLSLSLALQNKDTLLLDADLGMANSHILLGINPKLSLEDFISGKSKLDDVIASTKEKLKFVSGGNALNNLLNLSDLERHKIIQSFDNLSKKPDFMFVDIGAGAEASSMSFMAAANKVLIVLTGEPTSFIDAYSLIKVAFIDYKMDNFGVIINMAASAIQAKLNFDKFQSITQRFLDINLNFIGHVPSSLRIKNSIISRSPIVSNNKNSEEAKIFNNLSTNLLTLNSNRTEGIKFFNN
tara:strand:- start:872 stop:1648 length:777 start_codon:yes stop_codon:yes gene_type:complete